MGGCIQAHFVAGILKDCCKRVAARTFAIGSGNMYGTKFPVRMLKMLVKQISILQPFLISILAYMLEQGSTFKQISHCFFVCHDMI